MIDAKDRRWPWKVNSLAGLQKMFRQIGLDAPQYALMRELEGRYERVQVGSFKS